MKRITIIFSILAFLPGASATASPTRDDSKPQSSFDLDLEAPHFDAPGSELTERAKSVRGIYIPVGKVKSWRHGQLIRWIKQTGADAVILDVKDDMGRVVFTDDLPFAKGSPHGYNRKLGALVEKLKASGIYTIARVVCFKDNLLAGSQPKTGVVDYRTGKKWRDRSGSRWADPHSDLARAHIVSVAEASQGLGFDEVQLDYIRFPVEVESKYARYPNKKGDVPRYEVIAELLRMVDASIGIPLSIDVFGLTAYHPNDSEALGQRLEYLAPHVDAISPMVYLANWPQNYWENPKPSRTHAVIKGAVEKIRERLGDQIAVRPLLQGFKWRADNWGYEFIENQIDAAERGGSTGHLFWNASGNYRLVGSVWQDMDEETDEAEGDRITMQ